jgi:hypothetical protein
MVNSRRKVTVLLLVSSHLKATALLLVHLHKVMASSHLHQVSMASSDRLKVVPVDIQANNSMANRHQVAGTSSRSMYLDPIVWILDQMRAWCGAAIICKSWESLLVSGH